VSPLFWPLRHVLVSFSIILFYYPFLLSFSIILFYYPFLLSFSLIFLLLFSPLSPPSPSSPSFFAVLLHRRQNKQYSHSLHVVHHRAPLSHPVSNDISQSLAPWLPFRLPLRPPRCHRFPLFLHHVHCYVSPFPRPPLPRLRPRTPLRPSSRNPQLPLVHVPDGAALLRLLEAV